MADYHLRGPTDSWEQSLRTDDGCNARQPGCARGPVSGAAGGHASEWDPLVVARRAMAVYAAYRVGRERTPAAIVRATGLDDLPKLSKAVLSGMLQMALVVAASTAIGGLAGGAIGALFGGVGAAPGAAAGAEIGFNAGMAVLTWLGLAAIAVEVVRGIGEVTNLLQRGVVTAWEAEDAPDRQAAIEAAGELMAEAMAHLMLLVLMAIVARLSAAQAVAATERAAAASGELFAMLRRSQLGTEFATWVEANAERLMRNPSLRLHREARGTSSDQGESTTPSRLKAAPTKNLPRGKPDAAPPSPSGTPTLAKFDVAARAEELGASIPEAQKGRITMAVGLAEDAGGKQVVLIGTSEPRGYLRPGVKLKEGEVMVRGTGHAEADLVAYAKKNNLRLVQVGATRPICSSCAKKLIHVEAEPMTPLKDE